MAVLPSKRHPVILDGPKSTVSSSNTGEYVFPKRGVSPISASDREPEENEAIPPAVLGLSRERYLTIRKLTIVV